ncbi:MAG: RAMP superfamily CRISPR-associated protein [Pseudanabaena sp. ELA645]|jgi:CRISPR-associated protein Cmr6
MNNRPVLRNQNPNPNPRNNPNPIAGNTSQPSPWLGDLQPPTCKEASFVEYLRWMRSPTNANTKDGTKVELLQEAVKGDYSVRLTKLCDRIPQLVGDNGVVLRMTCPWRIRVGGHKGPESMLLPAFDSAGMPFIPATTLRGIARTYAINWFMNKQKISRKDAEDLVATYFGDLDAERGDRMAKAIFFDAYPLPLDSDTGGLAVDIVNNIWQWEGQNVAYKPVPNAFLSLSEPTFVIGLRPITRSTREADKETDTQKEQEKFEQIVNWLRQGLISFGAGAQIGSGYGLLHEENRSLDKTLPREFFRLKFELTGQLIHGNQQVRWEMHRDRQVWQAKGNAQSEVRPIAFKSTLRYWFRAFALGVLPADIVHEIEGQIFGGIDLSGSKSQRLGWLQCRILEGETVQDVPNQKDGDVGCQTGTLILSRSPQSASSTNHEQEKQRIKMMMALAWLAFHLGGVGQGARRPCYSRSTRPYAPWWRGTQLLTERDNERWKIPTNLKKVSTIFRTCLQEFYTGLELWSNRSINPSEPLTVETQNNQGWVEAIDGVAAIAICRGHSKYGKPHALAVLHDRSLNPNGYNSNLCGTGSLPSPVWIATPWQNSDIQVVTVFSSQENPRQKFLELLDQQTGENCLEFIWDGGLSPTS